MPPKTIKDMEETLQTIIEKLVDLHTQFHTTQETMGARQMALESKHDTLTNTLTSIFTTLSIPHHNTAPVIDPNTSIGHFSIDATTAPPPPLSNTSQPNVHPTTTTTIPSTIPPSPIRPPKIQLSFFYGTDPLNWLFQADQFFQFYTIPGESRLNMVDFYMRGHGLSWFKWMCQNHQLTNWISFSRALELRFGPSTYANHQAELFKLRQHGTVVEYQKVF